MSAPARPDDNAPFLEKVKWLLLTHAYCSEIDRVVRLYEPSDRCLLKWEAFQREFKAWADITTGPKGGVNVLPATARWEMLPERLNIAGVRMRPDRDLPVYEEDGEVFKNTFEKIEHAGTGDIKPWEEFIAHLLPAKVEREWFLDWLASKCRSPAVPGVSVIMVATDSGGRPVYGTGRGFLRDAIARLLGHRYVCPEDFSMLTGTSSQAVFNDYLAYSLLVTVSEAKETPDAGRWADRRAVYEHLKEIVDPRPVARRFKVKGLTAFWGIGYAAFLIASNNDDALQIPSGDRRFAVLRNGVRMADEMAETLTLWMEDAGNIAELAKALEGRNLSQFNPYKPPDTAAKTHMQELARDSLGKALWAIKDKLGRTALFTFSQILAAVHEEMGDEAGVGYEELKKRLYRPLRAMARHKDKDLKMPRAPGGERHRIWCWRDYNGPVVVDQATAVRAVNHSGDVLEGKTTARGVPLQVVPE